MNHSAYYRPIFSFRSCSNAVKCLIVVNTAVFIIQALFGGLTSYYFGLTPKLVAMKHYIWQPVTYMFLHGGLMHIFMNLFVLYMFGRALEEKWGSLKFVEYYFVCGISAGFFIILTSFNNVFPTIGASGAIYGLLAAYAVMFPETYVYLYFLFPIKVKYFAIIIGVISFISGFADRVSLISNFGHLGGLIAGYVYIKLRSDYFAVSRADSFKPLNDNEHGNVYDWNGRKKNESIPSETRVNQILDKILKEGINSLTEEEKTIMNRCTSGRN